MEIKDVVVISLKDYERFQELEAKEKESEKRKKEIDYDRLKVGSKVVLNNDNLNIYGGQGEVLKKLNFNLPFEILIYRSDMSLFNGDYYLRKRTGYCDITFIQNGLIIVYSYSENYITEVIRY